MARRIVAARRATKRSRAADRVDDGSLHSSGAGTGAGQEARRGRGGAGGPSISGAVWGASDARRLGAAAGCCPLALLVVSAVFSIRSVPYVAFLASKQRRGPLVTDRHGAGGANARLPGRIYQARNACSHTCELTEASVVDILETVGSAAAGALCTSRTARAPVGGSRRYRAEAAEPVLYL